MNHLSDLQLNEYLDNVLSETGKRECDLHLAGCASCRVRLDELQYLFASLDNLPEKNLRHDLSLSILKQLHPEGPRLWSPAFAAQLGAALGVLIWLSIRATELVIPSLAVVIPGRVEKIQIPQIALPDISFSAFQLSILNFQSLFSILHSPFSTLHSPFSIPHSLFSILHPPSSILHSPFSILHPPSSISNLPAFQLSPFNTALIVVSASALWLIGNAILLRRQPEVRK